MRDEDVSRPFPVPSALKTPGAAAAIVRLCATDKLLPRDITICWPAFHGFHMESSRLLAIAREQQRGACPRDEYRASS